MSDRCQKEGDITKYILVVGLSDNMGGIESFFHNYYKEMNLNKYRFDFVTTCDDIAFSDEYKKNNSRIYTLPNFLRHPIKYYRQVRSIMRENKYDVAHINMLSAANILPVKAALKEKIEKIIVHSHNADIPSGFLRKILHVKNKKYLRDMRLTRVACGEKAGKWMFGAKSDFLIINNAVDIKRFKFNKNNRKMIRAKYKLKDDDILLGNIGRFCEQKNQLFLIDVLNSLNNNYKLMLIGQGDLFVPIKKEILKYGLENRVIFVETTKEIEKYYSALDLFVFPSLFEGMPVAPVEAQMNGLKCLISDSVTDEVDLGNVMFLPLEQDLWRKAIYGCDENMLYSRDFNSAKINYFDISMQAKYLEDIYSNEKNEDIKVSVIIPAYNSKSYIKDSVSSVLSQSYSNIEVIVVDDGSSDGTARIVQDSFNDSRIVVIRQKNSGANIARGTGVKKANGDYCLFLDSDDQIKQGAIACLVNYIKRFDPDIIKYNAEIMPGRKKYNSYNLKGNNFKILKKDSFMEVLLCTPLLHEMAFNVYRTEVLKNNLPAFRKKLSFGEDFYVNLNVVPQIKKYLFVDDALYLYTRDNNNSTSSTKNINTLNRNFNDAIVVNEQLFRQLQYFKKEDQKYFLGAAQIIQNLIWPMYKMAWYDMDLAIDAIDRVLGLRYVESICNYFRDNKKFRIYLTNIFFLKSSVFHNLTIRAILEQDRKKALRYMVLYSRLRLGRK